MGFKDNADEVKNNLIQIITDKGRDSALKHLKSLKIQLQGQNHNQWHKT